MSFSSDNPPRSVVVTGGQGTLGGAIAEGLRAQGYRTIAPGRDELDVTEAASVAQFFRKVDEVDLLVCAAGIACDKLAASTAPHDWGRQLSVNLHGAFRCAQAAAAKMSGRRHGHIVFISSHSALTGNSGQAAYAASKSALVGLTHTLAREWGATGLRVNCLLPGFFESKMTCALSQKARERILSAHCLARTTTPDEVARFLVCLDSMLSVSGQVFHLDSRIAHWA